jgi:hypothetical protein
MNEVMERACRALWDKKYDQFPPNMQASDTAWQAMEADVRTVITAIREPTKEMILAMLIVAEGRDPGLPIAAYYAMIDEVLKP